MRDKMNVFARALIALVAALWAWCVIGAFRANTPSEGSSHRAQDAFVASGGDIGQPKISWPKAEVRVGSRAGWGGLGRHAVTNGDLDEDDDYDDPYHPCPFSAPAVLPPKDLPPSPALASIVPMSCASAQGTHEHRLGPARPPRTVA